jgi:hypothetical protein
MEINFYFAYIKPFKNFMDANLLLFYRFLSSELQPTVTHS